MTSLHHDGQCFLFKGENLITNCFQWYQPYWSLMKISSTVSQYFKKVFENVELWIEYSTFDLRVKNSRYLSKALTNIFTHVFLADFV